MFGWVGWSDAGLATQHGAQFGELHDSQRRAERAVDQAAAGAQAEQDHDPQQIGVRQGVYIITAPTSAALMPIVAPATLGWEIGR